MRAPEVRRLALKGRNRVLFYAQLRRNVERLLRDLGPLELPVQRGGAPRCAVACARRRARRARARRAGRQPPPSRARPRQDARGRVRGCHQPAPRYCPGATFAIRARRRDKGWLIDVACPPRSSSARRCRTSSASASTSPALTSRCTSRWTSATLCVLGANSRPPAACPSAFSGGRAVLSGGIDSPVAAYRAMKRGLRCEFVHFSGRPFTGPESIYKAYAQAAQLDRFQAGSRPTSCRWKRPAPAGERRRRPPAGDRPAAADDAHGVGARRARGCRGARDGRLPRAGVVADAPQPHRRGRRRVAPRAPPLVAWDKSEIVREAQDIGTYEIANLPAEDCCTLFASPLAEARAAPGGSR